MKTKMLVLILSAMALSACSSGTPDDSKALGSNIPGTTVTTQPPGPLSFPSNCNQFSSTSPNLMGKVKVFSDSWGHVNPNFMRLRFTSMPTNFENNDHIFIELYLWGVSPSGTIVQAPHPAQFRLEDPTNYAPRSGYFGWDSGNNTNVGFNRQAIYTASGTQSATSLTSFNILINGTTADYQVLRVVHTDTSTNPATQQYVDLLLPAFEANPNTYAGNHATVLNPLHPLYGRRTEGWTSAQYQTFTQPYCF